MAVAFVVFGKPEPQGSTRAFIPKGWTRAVITTDNEKLKPWRQQVYGAASVAMGEMLPTEEAVMIRLKFFFKRPKTLPKRVCHKLTKPDIDKLQRAILDALTGTVFVDDSQVIQIHASK